MSAQDEKEKAARLMVDQAKLPEQGGMYWFMGGVPPSQLPKPCAECIRFLAQLTDGELTRLAQRATRRAPSTSPETT
jgi:hypothetical protein